MPQTAPPSRRYPPLAAIAVVVFLALAVLPSTLTLPQASPSTTLEYAPVPPSGDDAPPPGGSFSSLGLASSGSIGSGDTGSGTGAAGGGRGVGKNPSTKRCVGNPPRQTEDPMSPPCVAFFSGDNFGATYPGVTGGEITALVVLNSTGYLQGANTEPQPPARTYCDIDLPPNTGGVGCLADGRDRDHLMIRITRAYSRYFNERYQTYGRHVHFWVYWTPNASSAETRRADAADNFRRLRPFAVLDQAIRGFAEDYAAAMAERGVFVYPTYIPTGSNLSREFFQRNEPLVWTYLPDVQHLARQYVGYVCRRVAPFRVSHAPAGIGADGRPMNGRERRYALQWAGDRRFPGLQKLAELVREGLKRDCGVVPAVEVTYPVAGAIFSTPNQEAALRNVAAMRAADVTTVLWAGSLENATGHAADAAKWYPEVVILGDGITDSNNYGGHAQNQNYMRQAWTISNALREDRTDEVPPFYACREGDPTLTRDDCIFATWVYDTYYMLFKSIQAAGPRLTPLQVDRGMHAIPSISSTSPYVASCFFDPGDYTCVKDAQEMWWDPGARSDRNTLPGCFRMVHGGRRHLPEAWPRADEVFANPADPCNGYTRLNLSQEQ